MHPACDPSAPLDPITMDRNNPEWRELLRRNTGIDISDTPRHHDPSPAEVVYITGEAPASPQGRTNYVMTAFVALFVIGVIVAIVGGREAFAGYALGVIATFVGAWWETRK